jgi:hypothetical protein
MRSELQTVLDSIRQIPADKLPQLLGELEVVRATAVMRLSSPASAPQSHDELLSIEPAAERLGVSRDYLYHNHDKFTFTRRMGRKLLFSSLGIDAYIAKKRG